MPSGERPGLLGALSRTIFGSHQVDEDSSSQDEEETHLEPEEGAGMLSVSFLVTDSIHTKFFLQSAPASSEDIDYL